MTGMLQKRISKLLTTLPLKSGRRSSSSSSDRETDSARQPRTLTVVCTSNHSTEDVLAQLQDVSENKHVTKIVLQEMIQRSDNAQLFSRIQDLLRSSKYFTNVQSIQLVEPHVASAEYRRWRFKKTSFLHRVRKEASHRHIDVTIHGTLIMDHTAATRTAGMTQNVSSWLCLLQQQLPQDPDITSLWISLREEAVVCTQQQQHTPRRPSQLDLLQSPVQKIFQALVELFNADTRRWQFIHCHVLYHPSEDHAEEAIHEEQTQSLLEVAELFHIPLQVRWEPIGVAAASSRVTATADDVNDNSVSEAASRIRTRTTSLAQLQQQQRKVNNNKVITMTGTEDDNTSTTTGMDGSSGAFKLAS